MTMSRLDQTRFEVICPNHHKARKSIRRLETSRRLRCNVCGAVISLTDPKFRAVLQEAWLAKLTLG
jgi:hypothetical protein